MHKAGRLILYLALMATVLICPLGQRATPAPVVLSPRPSAAVKSNPEIASLNTAASRRPTATPTRQVIGTLEPTLLPFVPLCPTERRIAFVSNRDGNEEIYVLDCGIVHVSQARLTHNPARDTCPTWSPDGRRIAFFSDRDGNWEIYVMDADGQGLVNLTNNAAKDRGEEWESTSYCNPPTWSPDGTQLAFVSNRDGNREIYVMNSDGSGQRNLTNDPAEDTSPVWSPDGSRIAFLSTRAGNQDNYATDRDIYVMDADGSHPANLTQDLEPDYTNSYAYDPAWSPDGTRIAFVGCGWKETTSGNFSYSKVFIMNADGSDKRKVTSNPPTSWLGPTWSPDGQKLAAQEHAGDGGGILIIDPQNGEGRSIAGYHGIVNRVSWSPDSRRIFFAGATAHGYSSAGKRDWQDRYRIYLVDPLLKLSYYIAEEDETMTNDFLPAVQP